MPNFTPTPEQEAIVTAARSTPTNLIVQALAGAAKTSTLVLIAEALEGEDLLCLAFNKKIQTEMSERLPTWCTASTLNAFGHRAWGNFLRKRLQVNPRKSYFLLKDWIDENLEGDDKQDFWENYYEDTKQAIDAAKTAGFVPEHTIRELAVPMRSLMSNDEFLDWLDFEPTDDQWMAITCVLNKSIYEGIQGRIDYDDQIYLSTLCKSVSFQRYPTIMIDEAQDLSALNHAMLWKLSGQGRSRLIAVGDSCQAIYGFRGAHQDSMNLLAKQFTPMEELTLSVSFRCPQAVVQEARWRAPHMKWPEWAVQGSIRSFSTWRAADIPEHAAIICRNNAPLFNMAFTLLKAGRYPELWGGGLDKYIIKVLKSLGSPSMDIDSANIALDLWVEREKQKRKDESKVDDKTECIRVFTTGEATTLGEAIAACEKLFSSAGPIKLMTGHKAKGLEFQHVFILDRKLLRMKEGQDKNLLYVMQTRAQETLSYIDSDRYVEGEVYATV